MDKLEAQHSQSSRESKTGDSLELQEAKWAQLMDSHREVEDNQWTLLECLIELAIKEQVLEVALRMHSLEQIPISDLATPLTAWEKLHITD